MDRRASLAVPGLRVSFAEQLPTLFVPQKDIPYPKADVVGGAGADKDVASPEHRLTVLALQLAVLEKAASRLGTLAFIWATVVLLGGFAMELGCTDFWYITVLLLIEGTRILGRGHELEWQHQAISCVTAVRTFSWMQLFSASACVSLSLVRLVHQQYGGTEVARTNRHAALNIFYGLALAEALLFLVEKAIREWKVGRRHLLKCVADDYNLAPGAGDVAIRLFFYESYSRCLNGSIFDGLHMDLVSYAVGLVTSGSRDEQSLGAGILVALAESIRFSNATLRKIGASAPTIERLIEMLSWKGLSEREVRKAAAVVVSMLTGRKAIAPRVTSLPGALESVASLLYSDLDELNILGLSILKKLAEDHENCDKIGNTRGLLDKIISYSNLELDHGLEPTTPTDMRLKAVKQSLHVVKRLANTTGNTGKLLRRELTDIVFTVTNVKDVLQRQEKKVQSELHLLAIEILTSLAMDKEAREIIGGTGGVVSVLVAMFLTTMKDCQHVNVIRVEAGEALAMLALESKKNCGMILMALGGGVGRLVAALSDPVVVTGAARILCNLCSYAGDEWQLPLKAVTGGASMVLRTIMVEKDKTLHIFLGLAAQILRFMEPRELRASLAAASVEDVMLVRTLVQVLQQYSRPSMGVPWIRRYTIELAVAMMRSDVRYVALFMELRLEHELRRVAETTSLLECFCIFSGSVGLGHRAVSVHTLVASALELMKKGEIRP